MYCPSCGSEERQLIQFCRVCGTDLRIIRNSLEHTDAVTQSAISAREHIGMAVADQIRQMHSAKELSKVAENVLPQFEKFLESPEDKRLRRVRAGVITSAVGLGATIITFIMAMSKGDVFPFLTPSFVTFLIGIGLVINGLLFTIPRKKLRGNVLDSLSLDPNLPRLPYELQGTRNLTNELAPSPKPQPAPVTEHTTHHLKTSKS